MGKRSGLRRSPPPSDNAPRAHPSPRRLGVGHIGTADVYRHKTWKATVRAWHQARPTTCEAPRCLCPTGRALIPGHRLWGLDVGHITSVRDGLRAGWTVERINALSNSRPEHRRCNRHAGARVGGYARSRPTKRQPVTSRDWFA